MNAIRFDKRDNVAVVFQNTPKDIKLDIDGLLIYTINEIPAGHKISIANIKKGSKILKYGKIIGIAATHISKGVHVHCHNVEDITEQICNELANRFKRKEAYDE